MTRIAHLLLAACALTAASAASLPQADIAPPALIQDAPAEQKPIEAIENDSVASPAEDIPVAVVLEDSRPSEKLDDLSDDDDIERPQADLRNPGAPQRQEHETQNPEYFLEEAAKLFSLKENIDQAQLLLKQGFQGVSDDIQGWISNNDQLSNIQRNIGNLRQTFSSQIQKLNESLQGFVKPQSAEPALQESQMRRDFSNIESRLKILQDNFNSGVNTLTEGVRLVASLTSQQGQGLRQAPGAPAEPAQPAQPTAPAAPAPANPPQNILVQYADMVSTSVSQSFGNVTQAIGQYFTNNNPITGIQNLLNPTTGSPAAGALADSPDGTTLRPNTPWQNWQGYFSNFFNGGQNQANQVAVQNQPGSAQGPFSGLQNLPIIQNVVQLIQNRPGATTTTTAKPAETVEAAGSAPAESNAVPEQPPAEAQANNDKPAETATLAPAPIGPIRQILNSIPVVQRIQNSLSNSGNPEKPREPVVKSDTAQIKGGYYGSRPRPSGDNNDSGIKEKSNIKEDESNDISERRKKPKDPQKEEDEMKEKEKDKHKKPKDPQNDEENKEKDKHKKPKDPQNDEENKEKEKDKKKKPKDPQKDKEEIKDQPQEMPSENAEKTE